MLYILIFLVIPFIIHEKLRTPYLMEYRAEFTSCPAKSKEMVWTLRRKTGLHSAETLQIDKDKTVIEATFLETLKKYYSLTETSRLSLDPWVKIKLKVIFYYTGVTL